MRIIVHPARLLLGLLLAGPALVRGQSAAAGPGPDPAVRLEKFSVTGSRLQRTDEEKVLPVTLLGRDQFEARDASEPADLLTMFPHPRYVGTLYPSPEKATILKFGKEAP